MSETYATPAEASLANPPTASAPTTIVEYIDTRTGEQLPANVTATVNDASDDLTAFRGAERDSRALSLSADFADAIDRLRAEGVSIDEVPGTPNPPTMPEPAAQAPEPVANADGLAPDLARALQHPQVVEAIEQELSATNHVRQQYSTGLANAQAFAQAALHELAPALSSIPVEHFQGAMATLAQVDPSRHAAVVRLLDNVLRIQAAKLAEDAHTAHGREAWARSESARFDAAVGPRDKEFSAELVDYAGELGVGRDALVHLMRTEPVLQSAAFQKVIFDAVQARLAQKRAAGWRARAAPKPIPPVTKPGTTQPRQSAAAADLAQLSSRLSKSGSLKDAAALLAAKRRG